MSRTDKVDAEKAGDDSPEAETGKIVETAGEALAKAGLEPSKAGRRIVGQGKPREPLRKRTYRTEKTEEENRLRTPSSDKASSPTSPDGKVAEGAPRDEIDEGA